MSDAQKAAAAQPVEVTTEHSLLDQIVEEGRLARDPSARERGKDLVKEFVNQVLEGSMTVSKDAEMMISARIAQIDHLVSLQLNEVLHASPFQKLEGSWRGLKYLLRRGGWGGVQTCALPIYDDQRADCADRSPGFFAIERGTACLPIPETGRLVARAEVPAGSERDQRQAEDQSTECHKEGTSPRLAARVRVRPERDVQESLRGGVRHLRRRALRRAGWRLRVRQGTGGYRAAGKGGAGSLGGARSVPDGGGAGHAEYGQLHGDRRAARHGEDFRLQRIRQVEELPAERGLALYRPVG